MNKDLTPAQRRRKLFPWFVLGQLLYGRHASVVWHGTHKCLINAPVFSKTLATDTGQLRKAVSWLKQQGYLTELSWGLGFVCCTIKSPIDRTPREELLLYEARNHRRGLRSLGSGGDSDSGAA